MANNRIYLRCRGCGEVLFLGKSYLDGFYYPSYDDAPLERRLNEFYDKHKYCENPKYSGIVPYDEKAFPMPYLRCRGCDGSFDIVYEDVYGSGYEGE